LVSTQLGVQRGRATLSALKQMPMPIWELSVSALDAWASLYDRLVSASENALAGDGDPMPGLFEQHNGTNADEPLPALLDRANDAVYDALELKPRERSLVEDLVAIRLELNDGKLGRLAVEPPKAVHLKRYGKRLKAELDDFVGDTLPKRHNVEVVHDNYTGMIHVALVRAAGSNDIPVYKASNEIAAELERTRRRLRRQHAQWVYFDRNLQLFEGAHTFIFKPMQRFQWTESQAMRDASEIIAKTLGAAGGKSD
jgi:hypothetical protein